MKRNVSLDGLRGTAALVVVVFHFLACFAPELVPAYSPRVPLWVDTPLGLVLNGSFAVSIFFVLSGFVLAGASSRSTAPIASTIFWRWVRLAVPATVSVFFGWLLLTLVPDAMVLLERHIASLWHRYVFQGTIPGPVEAATHGLFWIFVVTPEPGSFNNVLWTMKYEFIGSIGIYLFYRFVPRSRLVVLAAGAIAALALRAPMPYLAFAGGAMVFEVMARRPVMPKRMPSALLATGVLLAFPADGFVWRWRGGSLPGIIQPGGGIDSRSACRVLDRLRSGDLACDRTTVAIEAGFVSRQGLVPAVSAACAADLHAGRVGGDPIQPVFGNQPRAGFRGILDGRARAGLVL